MATLQRYYPYLLFLLTLVLLGLFGSQVPSVDSYGYAGAIRHGEALLHPHHIAYNWFNHQLYSGLQALGLNPEALQVARWHNIVAAGLALVFAFGFFRRVGQGPHRSFLAALGLLGCFGFWKMASVVEVYVPGLTFLVAICWYLAGLDRSRFRGQDGLALAGLLTGAVVYHQTNVLFSLPLAVFLVLVYGRGPGLKAAAMTLVPAGAACLGLYFAAAAADRGQWSVEALYTFMFHYELVDHDGWGTISNLAPAGWLALLKSQVGALIVGRYAAVFLYLLLFGLGIVGILGWNSFAWIKGRFSPEEKPIRGLMLTWLGLHYLFFAWWLPQEGEFFVVSLFPLLVLLWYTLRDFSTRQRARRITHGAFYLLLAIQLLFHFQYIFIERPNDFAEQEMARLTVEACPDDCYHITTHYTVETLQYYQRRQATGIYILLFQYYDVEPRWDMPDLRRKECILIDLDKIAPNVTHRGRNAYSYPQEWWKLVEDLFDIRQEAGQWSARKSKVLRVQDLPLLNLESEREALGGPEEVLENVVAQLAADDPIAADFRRWKREKWPVR